MEVWGYVYCVVNLRAVNGLVAGDNMNEGELAIVI